MRYYKILISSNDRLYGAWGDGVYNVQIPTNSDDEKYEWHLACETFVMTDTYTNPFCVTLPNLPLGDCTYSTTTKNNASIILVNDTDFYQRDILSNTIGLPISSPSVLRNASLRVQLQDAITYNVLAAPSGTAQWSMLLVVYGRPKKNPKM